MIKNTRSLLLYYMFYFNVTSMFNDMMFEAKAFYAIELLYMHLQQRLHSVVS